MKCLAPPCVLIGNTLNIKLNPLNSRILLYNDCQYKLLTKRSPGILCFQAIKLFVSLSGHAPWQAPYFQPSSSQSTVAWVSFYIGTS